MKKQENILWDAIIVGGSSAGLSAAMTLGRAARKVLLIDSGNPCNKNAVQAHNVITLDGVAPAEIVRLAREQVRKYETVQLLEGKVLTAIKTAGDFELVLQSGEQFHARKIVLATGVRDFMPDIPGFAESWGKSIYHCPYCHGFEVYDHKLGVMANGDNAYEFAKVIRNWTKDLTILTNEPSEITDAQVEKLTAHDIRIHAPKMLEILHENGQLKEIVFEDSSRMKLDALFVRIPFEQHSDLAAQLGCKIAESGLIEIDEMQKTSVHGVYAAGDNSTRFRAITGAMAAGTKSGAALNHELIEESF